MVFSQFSQDELYFYFWLQKNSSDQCLMEYFRILALCSIVNNHILIPHKSQEMTVIIFETKGLTIFSNNRQYHDCNLILYNCGYNCDKWWQGIHNLSTMFLQKFPQSKNACQNFLSVQTPTSDGHQMSYRMPRGIVEFLQLCKWTQCWHVVLE